MQYRKEFSFGGGGDFNITPSTSMDSSAPSRCHNLSLHSFLNEHQLQDVWRCQHASELDYTFFSPCHISYSRIDLFLMDQWTLKKISSSHIHSITWSDHSPVSITISDALLLPTFLWRMNTHVLQESPYNTILKDHLEEFFLNKDSVSNPAMLW